MKTDTQMTIEQSHYLIDNGYDAYMAKYEPENIQLEMTVEMAKPQISASELPKYKIDTISHLAIDDSNLRYNNASDSVVDVKVEEAKVFAQSAKDYKAFQAWDKNNKANSKPIDISVPVVKLNQARSTDEMFMDYNRYRFNNKKYNWS